jgi:hypothetical protein
MQHDVPLSGSIGHKARVRHDLCFLVYTTFLYLFPIDTNEFQHNLVNQSACHQLHNG